jgi:transposase
MLRPSFVPPPPIRKLRDLTRYRADLVAARTAEKQRVEKLLEDACIKLSSVITDIFGVSGRDMLAALVSGERDPKVLAQLARRSMRAKIAVLEEAFTGYFTDHHAFLLSAMLRRVDAISADIATLEERITAQAAPLADAVGRLDEIPGIGPHAAQIILAESGSPGTLPRRGPLRTVRARRPGTRLKQAPGTLRVLASCVWGLEARGGRRHVSSGFGSRPACRVRPGGRGSRRRSPFGPRSATTVPTPLGTGAGQR